ncbi:hypothetical protein HMI54_013599 [Coelomomyces lativittatus]|nr:hypothetical protein HMI54_013599 [Coelomomyces lativittatus]
MSTEASGTKQTLYTFDSIQNGLKMVQYSIALELKIQEEEFNVRIRIPAYMNLDNRNEQNTSCSKCVH